MTYKEAREYLQPVADNTPLAGYGEALRKAIEALESVEQMEKDLRGECECCVHLPEMELCLAGEKCVELFACDRCETECHCKNCGKEGGNWQWRGVVKEEGHG